MSKVSEIKEKLVAINRITKVVKGGRRFGFAALVVAGNQKGQVGYGQGKAKQVQDIIRYIDHLLYLNYQLQWL